jgi:glycosyltransferase involved in cell wall biosynthesis
MKKFVFTSYASAPEYDQPERWLDRIRGYTGILENLNRTNKVIGIERINYQGELEHKGVQYIFMRFSNKVERFPFRMHRLIKKMKPDVVFINGFIFPLQIIQLKLKLGKGVKILILHRAEKPFNGVRKYLQVIADKCVNGYLFASAEYGKEWMNKGIIKKPGKIAEIMQASSRFVVGDKAAARAALSIAGEPVYLFVGRLDPNKDPLTIVKAFIQFLSLQPLARLYMIYQDDQLLKQVQELIEADQKAMERIHLVGPVPHDQLQDWYNGADFILSGSHYEGSGVSVCEAMSCGCIPLVTDIASFRRMTGPGKCGLLFEPGNAASLLDVLVKSQQLERVQERDRVLQQFKEELSFEAIARKIDNLVMSL